MGKTIIKKGKEIKKLLILAIITISIVNAWEIQKVIDSEGTQTYVIKCSDGDIKVVYLNSQNGKYEVTPKVKSDSLDDASKVACNESK